MPPLFAIPSELFDKIVSYLDPPATAHLLITCCALSSRLASAMHQHDIAPKAGMHALHWAAEHGHLPLVQRILPLFPVDILGRFGETPLIASARARNNPLVLEHLLLHGADVNHVDKSGFTALHYACGHPIGSPVTADATARLLLARLLIAHGANVNAANPSNTWTPLIISLHANLLDLGRLLLDAGSDPNWVDTDGNPLTFCTVQYGYRDWLEMVLDYGADIERRNPARTNLLWYAVKCGQLGIIKMLLEKGVYFRDEDNTLLNHAISYRRNEIAEYLMPLEDVDVGSKTVWDETPIHIAAQTGWDEGLLTLIENGCPLDDVDYRGYTALRNAAAHGRDRAVSILLDYGANTEILDDKGNTPLMLAVRNGKLKIRDLLINAGANPTTEGSGV